MDKNRIPIKPIVNHNTTVVIKDIILSALILGSIIAVTGTTIPGPFGENNAAWAGTFPGNNGKIAFRSQILGNAEIITINGDGSDRQNLSNNPAQDNKPSWSQDGSKIAFDSVRGGNQDIYVINAADGSALTKLTSHAAVDSDPSWSPDGSKIAFRSDRQAGAEIYVMNAADGSNVVRLTNNALPDFEPSWSPDGSKIAFTRVDGSNFDIYVMNAADGSNVVRLTNDPAQDTEPSWSPDGSKIAFTSGRTDDDTTTDTDIYVMNAADGSGLIRLTNDPANFLGANDVGPSWSPDGSKIAFQTNRDFVSPEIYSINADGSGLTRLTNDNNPDRDPDWGTVFVPNQPPTANAGEDFAVEEGTTGVELQGSGADSDGSITSYLWEQIDGPAVILSNADTSTATFDAPSVSANTPLTFNLTVTDNEGATAEDTVVVAVNNVNQAPTANAGNDFSVNEGTAGVQLQGSGSSDPDGTINSYQWEQVVSGSEPTVTLTDANTATAKFDAPSVTANTQLTFNLTVTDNEGATAEDTVVVAVNNVNQNPIANAGPDQTVNEGDTVSLDGSASSDPDGTIESYSWTQTAGTSVTLDDASGSTPSFTAPDVGADGDTLTFELTVTDNEGATSTTADTVSVTVNNVIVNQPPTANAGPDQTVNEGDTVSLDGSASSDPDDDTLTYAWTQTGGTSVTLNDANTATPTFTAPDVGANGDTLTFELTVNDGNGHAATDAVSIVVEDLASATEFTIEGFYAPVDMEDANGDPIVNIIKSGRSVPMKFEVFDQNNVEQTSTDVIQSFKQSKINCGTLQGDPVDAVEITNTAGTSLRYEDGTFLQNWKTPPRQAGNCYSATVTTVDGSSITAYFKLN
jgi:dipeptidyl aminopeptidase/acylaminoacyl peptidase